MRCEPARDFTIGKAIAWRSSIDDDPPYQRAGEVWSLARRELFIDSLLNGYDVPKVYLHDLRGQHPTKVYAVVDGKQRLTTLWSFVQDAFPLAATFRIERAAGPDGTPDEAEPTGALRFSELDPRWRTALLRTPLSVVLIRDATESDIEELFSRLNNGVALSAAERRNALGGAMADLIRTVAATSGLFGALAFPADRGAHLEVAARLLLADGEPGGTDSAPRDASAAGLDAFVRSRRELTPGDRADLLVRFELRWSAIADRFSRCDPRLADPDAAVVALQAAWHTVVGALRDSDPVATGHGSADPVRPA